MKKQFLFKTMLTAGMLASIMNMTSCKDDFSEEQYLKKEYELAEQKSAADQVRALALLAAEAKSQEDLAKLQQLIAKETRDEYLDAYKNAGLLVDANFIVLDAVTKKGVENVTVSLMGKEATTSAEGVANFTDIAIGGGDIKLASENYYAATSPAIIAYQTPATSGNGGLPIKRTISATFNMVGKGTLTESSVTVKGKVSLDNDLTNAKTEVPQDITVSVDYAAALMPNSNSNGIQIVSYQLDNPDFQPAVVDATTGEYSIVVPALDGIKLVLPEIESDVKYIADNENFTQDSELDEFLLETGTAVFKTNEVASNNYHTQEISTGDLYKYEFDQLKGSGFDLEFKRIFDAIYGYKNVGDYEQTPFTPGDTYKTLPVVSMEAKGTDKINDDKIYLSSKVTFEDSDFKISGGENLSAGYYDINIEYTNSNGQKLETIVGNVEVEITNDKIVYKNIVSNNETINNVNKIDVYTLMGVDQNNQPTISREITDISIRGIRLIKDNNNPGVYTDFPNIKFTGGSPKLAASFEFKPETWTNWEVTIKNGGEGYTGVPNIQYLYYFNDIRNVISDEGMNLSDYFMVNTNGSITFRNNLTKVMTAGMDLKRVESINENIIESEGAKLDLVFTNYTDKPNDIKKLGRFVHSTDYIKEPTHKMVKQYEWVSDAEKPLEINILSYYLNVNPITVEMKEGTGKGYMNPKPQTDVSNPNTISASDAGKTITRDFKYGIGELKK